MQYTIIIINIPIPDCCPPQLNLRDQWCIVLFYSWAGPGQVHRVQSQCRHPPPITALLCQVPDVNSAQLAARGARIYSGYTDLVITVVQCWGLRKT